MTDRAPTQVLKNGALRYGIYDETTGALLRYEYIRPEDEPTQPGTPLTKMTLLSDETAAAIELEQEDPTVNQALAALAARGVLRLVPITLSASGWEGTAAPFTQTLAVSGVLADETKQGIWPTPASGSLTAWNDAVILAAEQGLNSLTFQARRKPAADISGYVLILKVHKVEA
nr:hypothetical protein [uncultured Oscillibacter sp.]